MKVIATNIGTPTTILWNGREEITGIYKKPAKGPIHLGRLAVATDTIADRKVHGGKDKACYLFSYDQYPYWKQKYPDLKWEWGMFGENLTVQGLDEGSIRIGDIYRIGSATVQVSLPREPCYKLGIRFGNQHILEQFIAHGYPGTYVRILEPGKVLQGDSMKLEKISENPLTVRQYFQLLYTKEKDPGLVELAIKNPSLPEYKRTRLIKWQKKRSP